MKKIFESLTDLVGKTPLLHLARIEQALNLEATIFAKLENFNPGGSLKDRTVLSMINDAERRGILHNGSVIVEASSGNTGISLAWIGTLKGYKVILTMPETINLERQTMLRALGAELVLTPATEGMRGALSMAQKLVDENPDSVRIRQFRNPANPEAHARTTGEEIWQDTDGEVDIIVAGVGTGGSLCGITRSLKSHRSDIVSVAVEPSGSPLLSGGKPGKHKIQGIGTGFVPRNFDKNIVDTVIQVTDNDAIRSARLLARTEGLLAGFSSGAALHAAINLAKSAENKGKEIVVVLPDIGERYLATILFNPNIYPL